MKLRPCLSAKNPYALSKHRYYELKHFCLQYPEWKKMYYMLEPAAKSHSLIKVRKDIYMQDLYDAAVLRADLKRNIEMVERVAKGTDAVMAQWIFLAVTDGANYTRLKQVYDIPCGKDLFYSYVRKFYYLLSLEKGL